MKSQTAQLKSILQGNIECLTMFESVKIDKSLYLDVLVGLSHNNLILFKPMILSGEKFLFESIKLDLKSWGISISRISKIESLSLLIDKKRVILKGAYDGEYLRLKENLFGFQGQQSFVKKRGWIGSVGRKARQISDKVKNPIVDNMRTVGLAAGGLTLAFLTLDRDSDSILAEAIKEDAPIDKPKEEFLADAEDILKEKDLSEKLEFIWEILS